MEKPLESAWVDLKAAWGRASRNQEGGANSVSQVDGVSDMAPACSLYKGKAQKRNSGLCHTSDWEKAAPQLSL